MILKQMTGLFNMVNPGTISHHQVLDLYQKYIDSQFIYEGFTLEEQNIILKAWRANAELSATKLLQLYPHIPNIQDAITTLFKRAVKSKNV
jgi:hypothetical protein